MLASSPVLATLPAENIDRAREFYTETVGLKATNFPEQDGVFVLDAGKGTQVVVYERERTKAEHTAATFFVDDVEAVVLELTARGVVFEQYDMNDLSTDERGIAVMGPAKGAWFKDTEGNIIALFSQDL